MAGETESSIPVEHWKDDPDAHDFPAASDYLRLVLDKKSTAAAVKALQSAPTLRSKAKDLLRASRLPLLERDDPHVRADLDKVSRGEKLSPVLLVRGSATHDVPLTIADGYHRVCASYHLDENEDVRCRLVDLQRV